MGADNKNKRIINYQKIYNPFNTKLISQTHNNRRMKLPIQNSTWFQKRRPLPAFTQKISRRIGQKFQNSPKIRRPNNKPGIPQRRVSPVPYIPNLAGGILQRQPTQKKIRPTQPAIFNKAIIHSSQVNQKIRNRLPQNQSTKKVLTPFQKVQTRQNFRSPLPNSHAAKNIRKPFINAQTIKNGPLSFPNTQVKQNRQRQLLRQIPNPNNYKALQRGNIKIYNPHELLRIAPRSEKNLWALITSRLPQNYTIPDINFVNLYRAFLQRKPKI